MNDPPVWLKLSEGLPLQEQLYLIGSGNLKWDADL